MSDCECVIPEGGWCERHQMSKSAHWVRLCQTRPDYWRAWEAGNGPGQETQVETARKPRGWGDQIEKWLTAHGITEDRYKQVKQMFGLPPRCGCQARKEWLNRVGEWVNQAWDADKARG